MDIAELFFASSESFPSQQSSNIAAFSGAKDSRELESSPTRILRKLPPKLLPSNCEVLTIPVIAKNSDSLSKTRSFDTVQVLLHYPPNFPGTPDFPFIIVLLP
jgi:hypothetical protein